MAKTIKASELILIGDKNKMINSIANLIDSDFKLVGMEQSLFEEFASWEVPKALLNIISTIEKDAGETKDPNEERALVWIQTIAKMALACTFYNWKRLKSFEEE